MSGPHPNDCRMESADLKKGRLHFASCTQDAHHLSTGIYPKTLEAHLSFSAVLKLQPVVAAKHRCRGGVETNWMVLTMVFFHISRITQIKGRKFNRGRQPMFHQNTPSSNLSISFSDGRKLSHRLASARVRLNLSLGNLHNVLAAGLSSAKPCRNCCEVKMHR